MQFIRVALCVLLSAHASLASAQSPQAQQPAERQLRGLSAAEADNLVQKLEQAQHALTDGKFQPFELLAGSFASYDQATVSARKAFLDVPFSRVWLIERIQTDNKLWQPYKLAYAPKGVGNAYWDIEVVLGSNGNIERVVTFYKPPAPF